MDWKDDTTHFQYWYMKYHNTFLCPLKYDTTGLLTKLKLNCQDKSDGPINVSISSIKRFFWSEIICYHIYAKTSIAVIKFKIIKTITFKLKFHWNLISMKVSSNSFYQSSDLSAPCFVSGWQIHANTNSLKKYFIFSSCIFNNTVDSSTIFCPTKWRKMQTLSVDPVLEIYKSKTRRSDLNLSWESRSRQSDDFVLWSILKMSKIYFSNKSEMWPNIYVHM